MGSQQEKRVILFLVEGPNDEIALVQPFKRMLASKNRVFSQAFHCDVTIAHLFRGQDYVKSYDNVVETVRRFVLDYLERERGYDWADIARIVHIVDTDGCFVPPSAVIADDSARSVEYETGKIRTANKDWIVQRNKQKTASIKALVGKRTLAWKKTEVPYEVYFCSRNFEHAFCGIDRELNRRQKDVVAERFRRRFEQDPAAFEALLKEVGASVPDAYGDSWKYIADGTRSLERHSNLFLLLDG